MSKESRNEAQGAECCLSKTISGRMEGGGNGRFDDLANEFDRKRGERHLSRIGVEGKGRAGERWLELAVCAKDG